MKVATERFCDPVTKKHLLIQVANVVKDENIRSQSQEDLTWSRLLAELSVHAPILDRAAT